MIQFLVSIAFAAAFAGDCSTKDYRRELGPNRNQDDLSWCFAYTSADLISQRIGQRVSATDLASTFILADTSKLLRNNDPQVRAYLKENPDFLALVTKTRHFEKLDYSPEGLFSAKGMKNTGGAEDVTVMLANSKGYCLEANFPSREKEQDKFFQRIRSLLRNQFNADPQKFCSELPEASDETSAIVDPVSRALARLYEEELEKKCRRQPMPTPLIPVMKKYADSLPEYLTRIERGEVRREVSERALLDALDEALDNHRVAAIGYSANLIMTPDPGEDDQHGDHSSTIVGRKKIGGTCHYLIRNTFGDKCALYLPKFRQRCEAGNVWVSAGELKESLYSVIHLK